jgi:hypothetical protein
MTTVTEQRTPLWQMTDEQLRFIADDDLTQWDRRITAKMILEKRNAPEPAVRVDEEDGA